MEERESVEKSSKWEYKERTQSSEKEILHDKIERDVKSERLEGKTAKDAVRRKK